MPRLPYAPTVAELARLMPSRSSGRWTGGAADVLEFPDRQRVEAVIDTATNLIAPQLGGAKLDIEFHDAASSLITLQTALLLEPTLWPEQARPEKSAWDQWKQMLDDNLKGLVAAIIRFEDTQSDSPGAAQAVISSFPPSGLTVTCPQEW